MTAGFTSPEKSYINAISDVHSCTIFGGGRGRIQWSAFLFCLQSCDYEVFLVNFRAWFSSLTQLCPTLCDPMNHSTPGLPVHHQLPELTQTHVHWVRDAIQPSHPRSSPSPPALNHSQYQGLFKWVSSSHLVAKGLEFQLQHQCFQWTPRTEPL